MVEPVQEKKDTFFVICIILIIVIPHIFVVFAHSHFVLDRFTTDDSFYYFKTAQNIIEGQGVTFDGIARANGFHPLWMFLLVPVFFLARYDLILPLRLVIFLQTILGLGSALVLYKLVRTKCSQWTSLVAALFWAFSPFTYDLVFKGGTEAGLNALFLVLLWWQYYRVSEKLSHGKINLKQITFLGGLASFTVLSRLDNVFLIFFVGGWLIIRFWRQPGVEIEYWIATIKWWIRLSIAYFAPIVATLGLYLVINQIYFGSAMPVSGKVKRWWGTLKFTVYGKPTESVSDIFSEIFSPDRSIGSWSIIISPLNNLMDWYRLLEIGSKIIFGLILISVFGFIVFFIIQNRKFVFRTFWQWNLIALFFGCIAHILYYKFSGHVAQKEWYWLAESLFVVLILGIVLESIAHEILKLPYGEKMIAAVSLILVISISLPYMRIPIHILTYLPNEEEHFYLKRARWLTENTEPNSLIGMTGSGSSGYFVQERVLVNLDGLINSQEYFIHLQNATADEYLEIIGLDYVFGNAYILKNTNPYQWNFDNRLEEYRLFELQNKTLTLFKFIKN
jgi:hypothetical protein